jgi:tetratricopeptide (TPR) repeat protein
MPINKLVAFVLGALVFVAVAALIIKFVPFSKAFAYFGITLFQAEEEKTAIDMSLAAFENAYRECSQLKADNCVCHYPINLELMDGMVLEIAPKEEDKKKEILITLQDYKSKINDSEYCFLEYEPEDLANWNFLKKDLSRDESRYTSKELAKIIKFEDGIYVEGPGSAILPLPYRLVRWHGKVCLAAKKSITRYGRRCNQLNFCDPTVAYKCNDTEFCKGVEDPFYSGPGKCCAVGCSATPVQPGPEQLLVPANEYYDLRWYSQALPLYQAYLDKYPDHDKAIFYLKRVIDIYLELGNSENAIFEFRKLIMLHPELMAYPGSAERNEMEKIDLRLSEFMKCGDLYEDTIGDESLEEKNKCNNDRDSVLRGCWYDADSDTCKQCIAFCSQYTDKDTCLAHPCANVGSTLPHEVLCTWSWWSGCKDGSRPKYCRDIKTKEACQADPCVLGFDRCCLWNYTSSECDSR